MRFTIPENHITNRRPRIMGIVLIAVGLLAAKWQIFDPLHAAERQREEVWILYSLVAIGVYFPAYGTLLLLFGKRPNQWFAIDPQNLSWKNTLYLLLFGAVGLAVVVLVIRSLERQGYVIMHW